MNAIYRYTGTPVHRVSAPGSWMRSDRGLPDGAVRRLEDGWVRQSPLPPRSARNRIVPRSTESPRLVFLLSAERSGSTLLSMALGGHSRIVAPPELHLLAYEDYAEWIENYAEALGSLQNAMTGCGHGADPNAANRLFQGKPTRAVYEWFLGEGLGQQGILLDKTPKYARSAETLARLEEFRPHYIWLVRHPLGVAASQLELREERRQMKDTRPASSLREGLRWLQRRSRQRREVEAEVAYWLSVNRNIEFFLAGIEPERQIRVNFESFVRSPYTTLASMVEWMGLDFEESTLDPQKSIPAEMNGKTGDPKIRRFRGIDPATADRWRGKMQSVSLDPPVTSAMKRWGV